MDIKATNYSNFFSQRSVLDPFTKKTDTNSAGKAGIRSFSRFTSVFLKKIGLSGKIVDIHDVNGNIIPFDKKSLNKWLKNHQDGNSYHTSQEYEEAIKNILDQIPKKTQLPWQLSEDRKIEEGFKHITDLFAEEGTFENLPILDIKGEIKFEDINKSLMQGVNAKGKFLAIKVENQDKEQFGLVYQENKKYWVWEFSFLDAENHPESFYDWIDPCPAAQFGFQVNYRGDNGPLFQKEGYDKLKNLIEKGSFEGWTLCH